MIHEVIQSITPEQAIELIAFAQDCISASQKKSGEIMNGTLSEGSRIVASQKFSCLRAGGFMIVSRNSYTFIIPIKEDWEAM